MYFVPGTNFRCTSCGFDLIHHSTINLRTLCSGTYRIWSTPSLKLLFMPVIHPPTVYADLKEALDTSICLPWPAGLSITLLPATHDNVTQALWHKAITQSYSHSHLPYPVPAAPKPWLTLRFAHSVPTGNRAENTACRMTESSDQLTTVLRCDFWPDSQFSSCFLQSRVQNTTRPSSRGIFITTILSFRRHPDGASIGRF